jgi:hypothetical protein
MSNTTPVSSTNTTPVSSTPDPVGLSPEAVVEQLRTMQSHIDEVAPLSQQQRTQAKRRLRLQPTDIVHASINVLEVLDNVSQAIGQPLDEVRQLQTESVRWETAIDQTRTFLKCLEGANLNRRQRLALIGTQAYMIGTQLAKDPNKAVLLPQVEEIKRLKRVSRRKKAAQAPQTPSPVPPAPVPVTSTAPKA